MTLLVYVGLAGSVGAVARYLLDGLVQDRTTGEFPFGTLTVNVVGAFILGTVTALAARVSWIVIPATVIGAGFCGALTTWSTASWETIRLAEDGAGSLAVRYLATNIVASLAAAGLGFLVVRVL